MKSLEEREKKTRAELEIGGIGVEVEGYEDEYASKRANAARV